MNRQARLALFVIAHVPRFLKMALSDPTIARLSANARMEAIRHLTAIAIETHYQSKHGFDQRNGALVAALAESEHR